AKGGHQLRTGVEIGPVGDDAGQEAADEIQLEPRFAQHADAPHRLFFGGAVVAIAGCLARRTEQALLLIIAQHPHADAGTFRQCSNLHCTSLTLTALSDCSVAVASWKGAEMRMPY